MMSTKMILAALFSCCLGTVIVLNESELLLEQGMPLLQSHMCAAISSLSCLL